MSSNWAWQNESNGDLGRKSKPRILFIAGGTDGIGFSLFTSEMQRSKYTKIFVLGRDFTKVRRQLEQRDNSTSQVSQPEIVYVPCDITQPESIGEVMLFLNDSFIHDFVFTIGSFHRGKIADIMPITAAEKGDVVADHFHLNCVSAIHLIRSMVQKLVKGDSQILVCTASLSVMARSPYALQSATKAALRAFIDTLRIELKGRTRVMNLMPPSVDTQIFAKAGDDRATDGYPPPSRIANTMQYMLDCPPDICIPEILIEQHHFDIDPE